MDQAGLCFNVAADSDERVSVSVKVGSSAEAIRP